MACLIARISAISSGLRDRYRKSFFKEPMPCSAEIDHAPETLLMLATWSVRRG